jgi:hypothetical protein
VKKLETAMAYFKDLSTYEYRRGEDRSEKTLNVGWIDRFHSFEVQECSPELKDALWSFCEISINQTRGIHRCEICSCEPWFVKGGEKLLLGSAEIRSFGRDDFVYAAPDLIYHYVVDHQYRPPQEFTDSLFFQPVNGEYFLLLEESEIDWHWRNRKPI